MSIPRPWSLHSFGLGSEYEQVALLWRIPLACYVTNYLHTYVTTYCTYIVGYVVVHTM